MEVRKSRPILASFHILRLLTLFLRGILHMNLFGFINVLLMYNSFLMVLMFRFRFMVNSEALVIKTLLWSLA